MTVPIRTSVNLLKTEKVLEIMPVMQYNGRMSGSGSAREPMRTTKNRDNFT